MLPEIANMCNLLPPKFRGRKIFQGSWHFCLKKQKHSSRTVFFSKKMALDSSLIWPSKVKIIPRWEQGHLLMSFNFNPGGHSDCWGQREWKMVFSPNWNKFNSWYLSADIKKNSDSLWGAAVFFKDSNFKSLREHSTSSLSNDSFSRKGSQLY